MHTIRKGEPRDIAAIAVIYDRILDREERGGASTGWIRDRRHGARRAGGGGAVRHGARGPRRRGRTHQP